MANEDLLARLSRYRRCLHSNPELSHQELRTAAFIEQELRAIGCPDIFRPAPTSVCALFGSRNQPTIAIRADIDALPITETGDCDYRSTTPGVMHACGHDGHTAALLGVAATLANSALSGRSILLIFQQAEESYPAGAPMVLDGLPHDISLTTAYGFHLWPELPVGSVGLVEGPLMAAVDGITLHVECAERGPQHGTKAEAESVDAITVLLDVYDELRRHMRRRALSRVEPWTLQVGRIRAGEKPNSVARAGTLFGTLRTLDDTSRAEALTFLKSTLDATCLKHGIGVRGRLESATNIRPHLVNDDAAVNKMRTAAAASGVRALRYPEQPLGISEDFGWYLTRCPGAFMLVGCTSPGADVRHLHQPDFDFDETAMLLSVHILTALATEVQQASD